VLTACVAGLYILVVGYSGRLLHVEGNLTISLIATGVVAVVFQPLRERVQRGVDRLLYGERDDPYGVLERLGQRLESTLASDAVLPTIAETIAQALKLPYAAIALRHGESFATAAAWGTAPAYVLTLPLVYQSEMVGQLRLGPRAPGEHLSAADRRVLEGIAHQAGVAARAVQLTADLQRSRERLVAAREEERRRLRRDLHDGLGPTLAGLAARIDAAKNVLRDDAETTERLLDELKIQTQAAIADIRRVVYDLRPPALDELGLVSALREHAVQYGVTGASSHGLTIRIEVAEPLPPLPAAVEVAAFRIALEALTNVARHSGARHCVIRLDVADVFEIDIRDDGRGIPAGVRPGVGLTSMRERCEELGGALRIESPAGGGARLRATLPLSTTTQ
jgi:signal transduction histidine kinase